MHPTLYPAPFTAAGWVFENKFDGFRALARKSGDKAELISRRGRLLARAFPEVIQAIAMLPHDAVLDAELVVSDERGHPAWDRLRRRSVMSRALRIDEAARLQPAVLCVFDLLSIDGEDLRPLPLLERKRRLADLLPETLGLHLVSASRDSASRAARQTSRPARLRQNPARVAGFFFSATDERYKVTTDDVPYIRWVRLPSAIW